MRRALPALSIEDLKRFNDSIEKSADGCWLWRGAKTPLGYGTIKLKVRGKWSTYYSHRLSWLISFNADPGDLLVMHKCDNPSCVRADHLSLGTDLDNAADRESKGRGNQARGEAHGHCILKPSEVLEIRSKYSTRTASSLAKEYGVTPNTIYSIVTMRTWRHCV